MRPNIGRNVRARLRLLVISHGRWVERAPASICSVNSIPQRLSLAIVVFTLLISIFTVDSAFLSHTTGASHSTNKKIKLLAQFLIYLVVVVKMSFQEEKYFSPHEEAHNGTAEIEEEAFGVGGGRKLYFPNYN